MITDRQNRFSSAQTVTDGSENGVYSTDVIDLSVARDIGAGENLYLVVDVTTATTGAGDTALVQLVTDDNADLNSPTVVQTIGQFAANSAVGSRLIARIQPATLEQFIAVKYTANGDGPLETGAFSAYIVSEVDYQRLYAGGSAIE